MCSGLLGLLGELANRLFQGHFGYAQGFTASGSQPACLVAKCRSQITLQQLGPWDIAKVADGESVGQSSFKTRTDRASSEGTRPHSIGGRRDALGTGFDGEGQTCLWLLT